jgi:hypothetical protein
MYYRGGANFNIEDHFPKEILNYYALKSFKSLDTLMSKKDFKNSLKRECEKFVDEKFKFFTSVFDLILKIKVQE